MNTTNIIQLTNAKSIIARVFTEDECAENHCQIGNIGLALDAMVNWIEEKRYWK